MTFLCDRIVAYVIHNKNDDDSIQIALQVLNHLRYCDVIYEPKELMTFLLRDAIPQLPLAPTLQVEIISGIPALCPDSGKDDAIKLFLGIIDTYPDLMPSVLEAISNLCLQPFSKSLKIVFDKICSLLGSAEANLIPVSVRALLELPEDPKLILPEVRTKLNEFLKDCVNEDNTTANACTLIMNILKTVFTTKPALANEFLDMISKEDDPNSLNIVDMWILFGLCTTAKGRPKVQSVLFKKITNGSMSKAVIIDSIRQRGTPLDPIFSSMLNLAQSLMSSNRIFGSSRNEKILIVALYQELYHEFDTAIRRQEIVASLVSHVGSPNPKEVDYALAVLSSISVRETRMFGFNQNPQEVTLKNFVPFLKSIFEDVRGMTEAQVRVFFEILFECSTVSNSSSSTRASNADEMAVDDILIYLNKYANSLDFKVRKIAIIGYVAYLCQASMIRDKVTTVSQDDEDDDRSTDAKVQRLEQIFNSMTRISDDTCGENFLLDEISDAILKKKINSKKFVTALSTKAFEYLESSLAMDLDSAKKSKASIIAGYNILNEPQYGVDVDPLFVSVHPEPGGSYLDVIHKKKSNEASETTDVAELVSVKVLSGVLTMLKNGDVKSHTIPLSLSSSSSTSSSSSSSSPSLRIDIRCICSYLRLVSTCQHYLNRHYQIGLLVGAAIELPTPDCISEKADLPHSAQIAICWSLKYAVDWTREILNTFCVDTSSKNTDPDESVELPILDGRIIYTANQLVILTDILIQQAQMTPGFVELLDLSLAAPTKSKETNSNKSKPKKSTKAKEEHKDNGPNIDLVTKVIMSSLRSLDPCVASILGYGLAPKPINNQTPSKTDTLAELQYLDNPVKAMAAIKLTPKAMDMLLKFATTSILQLATNKEKIDTILDIDDDVAVNESAKNREQSNSALYDALNLWQNKGLFESIHVLIQKFTNALNGRNNNIDNESELFYGTMEDEVMDASSALIPQYVQICTIFDILVSNKELVMEIVDTSNKDSMVSSQSSNSELPLLIRILFDVSRMNLDDAMIDDASDPLSNICEYGFKAMFDNLAVIVERMREPTLLETAVMTVNTMEKILIQIKYFGSTLKWNNMDDAFNECSSKLARISDRLLQLSWVNDTIGKRKFTSKDVGILARIMVQYAEDPILKVLSVIGVLDSINHDIEDDNATNYPTAKSSTYILFYSPLYQALTRLLTDLVDSYKGEKDSSKNLIEYDFEYMVRALQRIVSALQKLMMITKGDNVKNSVLLTALREGGKFVAMFMKGERLIKRLFNENTESTLKIISILQKSTRQMQVMCVHGKLNKNASLSKEVPAIKRLLEKMIYMMKKLLEMNHTSSAFTVGSLKQRNLDGSEWLPSADLDDHSDEGSDEDDKENDTNSKKRARQSGKPFKAPSMRSVKAKKNSKGNGSDNDDDDDDDDNHNDDHNDDEQDDDEQDDDVDYDYDDDSDDDDNDNDNNNNKHSKRPKTSTTDSRASESDKEEDDST